jgi:HK97 family phage portal protein
MSIWNKFFGRKDSQSRIALSFRQVGAPQNTPKNYEGFAREGYNKNVIVYRCVNMIAKSCAGIDWELYQKRMGGKPVEIENHALLDLIEKPNPMQGRASFFEAYVAYYMLTGNSFIESVKPTEKSPPMELWTMRPDKMQIVPGPRGYPQSYIFKAGEISKMWNLNPVTMQSDVLHMRSFNPLNDWWGMSPLEAAMYSVDQNNAGSRWNLSLLQNSATPSGVLQMKATDSNPGGILQEEQFARLKGEIETEYMGAKNAGRPMLLEGGLEWKQISMSLKDMEFIKNKEVTAIDICEAFGVPPEMVGLGQKTYSNYAEARMSFYEDTVLPIMDQIQTELNNWLVPMFGKGLELKYDKDDIEALAPKRQAKFTAVQSASFLTVNEKRTATGYEPLEGWDVIQVGTDLISSPEDLNAQEQVPPVQQTPKVVPQEASKPEASDEEEDPEAKAFNLINKNERQASWKAQNWKRKRLESAFDKDLVHDMKEMYSDIAKAAKQKEPKMSEYAMLKAIDDNMPTIQKTIQRHIKYTVNAFGDVIFNEAKSFAKIETKGTRQYEDWAQRYIKTRTANAIGAIEQTTKKQVQKVVKQLTENAVIGGQSNEEMASQLTDEFPSLSKSRSRLIARTEVASASGNASLNAVKSLQLPNMMKEWVSSDDDRTRDDPAHADHLSMNGVSVPLDNKFTVPPDTDMDGPGDASAGPEQICNCRCVLVYKSRN